MASMTREQNQPIEPTGPNPDPCPFNHRWTSFSKDMSLAIEPTKKVEQLVLTLSKEDGEVKIDTEIVFAPDGVAMSDLNISLNNGYLNVRANIIEPKTEPKPLPKYSVSGGEFSLCWKIINETGDIVFSTEDTSEESLQKVKWLCKLLNDGKIELDKEKEDETD